MDVIIRYLIREREVNNKDINRTELIIMEMSRYGVECVDQIEHLQRLTGRDHNINEELIKINNER